MNTKPGVVLKYSNRVILKYSNRVILIGINGVVVIVIKLKGALTEVIMRGFCIGIQSDIM